MLKKSASGVLASKASST